MRGGTFVATAMTRASTGFHRKSIPFRCSHRFRNHQSSSGEGSLSFRLRVVWYLETAPFCCYAKAKGREMFPHIVRCRRNYKSGLQSPSWH